MNMKKIIITLTVLAVVGLAIYFVADWYVNRLNRDPNFAHGNGRIEATEINIAARLSGKVEKIFVMEGDKVKQGQILVAMQTNVLVAQLAQAEAQREQAIAAEGSAQAKINYQKATLDKMRADLERVTTAEKNAESNYKRYKDLNEKDATTQQLFEATETKWHTARAERASAIAAIREAEANLKMAYADAKGAKANILAAEAEIDRIKEDISDSILKAPLGGRIQYRIAEPGEVLSEGGRALNMVDLTDVYITFFLPEETAGKVRIGSDVRIVLDAAPKFPLPAKVTYVANVAQFTPKTVETSTERQKLMFRIKAHIDRDFLDDYIDIIKTGLPGVAWVKLNNDAAWPKQLEASAEIKAKVEKLREEMKKNNAMPSQVIKSNTAHEGKVFVVNPEETIKKMNGATKEKQQGIVADTMKTVNAAKKPLVEATVKQAKEASKEGKPAADAQAEAAKKLNDAKKQEPAAPNGKATTVKGPAK